MLQPDVTIILIPTCHITHRHAARQTRQLSPSVRPSVLLVWYENTPGLVETASSPLPDHSRVSQTGRRRAFHSYNNMYLLCIHTVINHHVTFRRYYYYYCYIILPSV